MVQLWETLLNLIFPPRQQCPLCHNPSENDLICTQCSQWLATKQKERYCYRCGRPVNNVALCSQCMQQEWPFTLARAVAPYSGPLKKAIQRFKYHQKQKLAVPLGRLMVQRVINEPLYRQADLIVPVPLADAKLRRRGFNQATLLARQVSVGLNIPLNEVLRRTADTSPQVNLNRQQRMQNLQQAFTLKNNINLSGKTALLIEDVITTGGTVSAATEVLLKQGGVKQVLVLTLAATAKST